MVDVGASWCPVSSPQTRHHRATGVAGTRPRDDGDGVDDADARDAARASRSAALRGIRYYFPPKTGRK